MAWPKHRSSKFKNERTEQAGISFSSKGEAGLHQMLLLMEKAGEVSSIRVQDHVYLTDARILYIADFVVWDVKLSETVWIEYKGFETDVWRIKRRLWMHYGPGKLRVYKGQRGGITLKETLDVCRKD